MKTFLNTAVRLMSRMILSFAALWSLAGCHPSASPPGKAVETQASSHVRLADVTQRAGIRWQRVNGAYGQKLFPETTGGGGAFIDYDNDGYPDIVLVNGDWWPGHALSGPRPTMALYHNNRDGTFTDVTNVMGLNISMQGMGVAVGDYDNDGYDDLYITGVGGNRLFHNEQGKRFVEVTAQAGVGGTGWSTSAAWIDVDNDGKLDLFVCHYVAWSPATDMFCGTQFKTYCTPLNYRGESCRLYHNDGNGRFHDVTRQAHLYDESAKALGVCAVDINHDGRTDLIVANDQEPNFVFENNGDGTFTSVGVRDGLALAEDGHVRAGMGIDAADYKNDGKWGILVGNFSFQGAGLHRESQQNLFSDVAREAGVMRSSYAYVTFGAVFCDLDNDGWKDIALANGHVDDLVEKTSPTQHFLQPPVFLRNNQDGTFSDINMQVGAEALAPLAGRGLAWGDFDNDGRIDLLLIPNTGPPRLLHNESASETASHWITFTPVGVRSNRDGYGATIRVTAGGLTQSDTVRSGSSYCSHSDRRLHFGLGSAAQADKVEITWPGGQKDSFGPLEGNKFWTLTEGKPPRALP